MDIFTLAMMIERRVGAGLDAVTEPPLI